MSCKRPRGHSFPESTHIKSLDRMAQQARDYLDRNNKDNNI